MAKLKHLEILQQGVEAWNKWRQDNRGERPDLSGADLSRAFLFKAYLSEANLTGANLFGAILFQANLNKADLSEANLTEADLGEAYLIEANLNRVDLRGVDLRKADLRGANLRGADLFEANLNRANLTEADLGEASLKGANLVSTNLAAANLSQCKIFGISAWKVITDDQTIQSNLIITDKGEPEITVDNLEVAQFIYLLLHNEKLRDVIHTIGEKAVLILGRFSDGRKEILYAMRDKLREKGFLPIIFDFERATERDFTETIQILAGMALFVITDISSPRSNPLELQATVPDYMVPFVPILQKGEEPFAMFVDLQRKYRWVMDVIVYNSKDQLIECMDDSIIKPALHKHNELLALKNEALRIRNIDEF